MAIVIALRADGLLLGADDYQPGDEPVVERWAPPEPEAPEVAPVSSVVVVVVDFPLT